MGFPASKTKIVCTIGPVSDSQEVIEALIKAGMNVARLNFSHGDFEGHGQVIARIRRAEQATGRRLAIMADLPGPKMRIGDFAEDPIELHKGDAFTLTTRSVEGNHERVSVSLQKLPQSVHPGNRLFLNDGIIQLEVVAVSGEEVRCRVATGGTLSSRKGLNLPGIDLGISAFTDHDRQCLAFALKNGVDAVSQSFVETAQDLIAVKEAAAEMGHDPFVIAKIERSGALENLDEILEAADGIMVARGDLGVEIPIEQIAVAQKRIMQQANRIGKPVITATQMLESMTVSRRPTRAEATDVANAILDGTDCVMLSAESATGRYPLEATRMLASIAAAIEPHRGRHPLQDELMAVPTHGDINLADVIALGVATTLERITPDAVIVPTRSGATARRITRFRLPVWIVGVSSDERVCRGLCFSYGVYPVCEADHPTAWRPWIQTFFEGQQIPGKLVVLTEGPSRKHPERNNRMEIINLEPA